MFPNLFALLRADTAVTAILGTAPMRFYRHGMAPQQVVAPYVTQLVIDAAPANHLDGTPPVDVCRVQVSIWSTNTGADMTAFETLASAVRDCIEARWHIVDIRDMGKDFETGRYRVDLDVTVFDARTVAAPAIPAGAILDEGGDYIADEGGSAITEEA